MMKDGWSRLVTEEELRLRDALKWAMSNLRPTLDDFSGDDEHRKALATLTQFEREEKSSQELLDAAGDALERMKALAPIIQPIVGKCQSCGRDTIRASGEGYLCSNIDCQAFYKKSVNKRGVNQCTSED